MKLPTDYWAIMAEDVRHEEGGKISIMGALTGDDLVISGGVDWPLTIAKLCFVVVLKDGEGTWNTQWGIQDEDGEDVTSRGNDFELIKRQDVNHTIVIQASSVTLPKPGPFKLLLSLDDARYEFTFRASVAKQGSDN